MTVSIYETVLIMGLGDIPSYDVIHQASDALNSDKSAYLAFDKNKPVIKNEAPQKIDSYALEAFKQINEIMIKTEDPASLKEWLNLAHTVHNQLSSKTSDIFAQSGPDDFAIVEAEIEYEKLKEAAQKALNPAQPIEQPPSSPIQDLTSPSSPPISRRTPSVRLQIKENKRQIQVVTQNYDQFMQSLSLEDPEALTFQSMLALFPGLRFTDMKAFNQCRDQFNTWKNTYTNYSEKVKAIKNNVESPQFKQEFDNLEQLEKQTEKELTKFTILFIRYVSKDESITGLDQAVLKLQELQNAPQDLPPVVDLKIQADYKYLLSNANINKGVEWLNALMEAYEADEGDVVAVTNLAEWLKEASENLDEVSPKAQDAIKDALDRVGNINPDKTLIEYIQKQFKTDELEYPFKVNTTLTPEMENKYNALNNDKALQEWMDQVKEKGFSKAQDWKCKEDFYPLIEKAVLIHCKISGDTKVAAEAKALAKSVVSYYLTNVLHVKYQG